MPPGYFRSISRGGEQCIVTHCGTVDSYFGSLNTYFGSSLSSTLPTFIPAYDKAGVKPGRLGKADNVASTRASETAWDAGDCIGISTSSTSTKGKTNYINIRYQTDGNVFNPVPGTAGEDNTIYFQGTSPMEFTAYYPCQGVNGTKPGNDGIITLHEYRTLTYDINGGTGTVNSSKSLKAPRQP